MGSRRRVLLLTLNWVLSVALVFASASIRLGNDSLRHGEVVKRPRWTGNRISRAPGLVRFRQTGLGRGEAGRCWFQGNKISGTGFGWGRHVDNPSWVRVAFSPMSQSAVREPNLTNLLTKLRPSARHRGDDCVSLSSPRNSP